MMKAVNVAAVIERARHRGEDRTMPLREFPSDAAEASEVPVPQRYQDDRDSEKHRLEPAIMRVEPAGFYPEVRPCA
jgi:hypothetical protein